MIVSIWYGYNCVLSQLQWLTSIDISWIWLGNNRHLPEMIKQLSDISLNDSAVFYISLISLCNNRYFSEIIMQNVISASVRVHKLISHYSVIIWLCNIWYLTDIINPCRHSSSKSNEPYIHWRHESIHGQKWWCGAGAYVWTSLWTTVSSLWHVYTGWVRSLFLSTGPYKHAIFNAIIPFSSFSFLNWNKSSANLKVYFWAFKI